MGGKLGDKLKELEQEKKRADRKKEHFYGPSQLEFEMFFKGQRLICNSDFHENDIMTLDEFFENVKPIKINE